MTLALTGLVAGFVHVLSGPDHLAAIAPYSVRWKTRAWRMGVRWGLGHGTGVLIVGILAVALRHALSIESLSAWSESCVGFVLVAIGIWGLRAALTGRGGAGHAHPVGHTHVHGRVAVAVGTLHGLAGSSHLMGILPALALPSDLLAGAYLLLFVVGSVVAMGIFSAVLGSIAGRPVARGIRMERALLALCATIAIVVGVFWIFR
jgi:hypothetical protein